MLQQLASSQVATQPPQSYLLTTINIALLFFIMLGPVKIVGPFHAASHDLAPNALRALALKVVLISTVSVLLAGLVGSAMMQQWHIGVPTMELTASLVFLLAALKQVLDQYAPPVPPAPGSASGWLHLVFPVVIPPYGIAALMVLMALSASTTRGIAVIGVALLVMALNLAAMLLVRRIMRGVGPLCLQIFGSVLAVLQVALALQLMFVALARLGVTPLQP
jgi:multiple antibiotic resistance protein